MLKKRYVLDPSNLQFRHHRLPWRKKILHFSAWFAVSVAIAIVYNVIYNHFFESTKIIALNQKIESIKLDYSILNKKIDNAQVIVNDLRLSDEKQFRPVLKLDSLSGSTRHPGYGGVDRSADLTGYENSDIIIKTTTRVEDLMNQVNVQKKSFDEVETETVNWKTKMAFLPYIRPVKVTELGDKMGYRPQHPVTGLPAWHYGQDFRVPPGTQVFATGAGTVVESGWSSGGFGNYVVIDHGYGYMTTYGHLSRIEVSKGLNVNRGDLIGLSGNTGISSGPHLHYQIDLFGQHENPLSYFDNNLTEEEYADMIRTLNAQR